MKKTLLCLEQQTIHQPEQTNHPSNICRYGEDMVSSFLSPFESIVKVSQIVWVEYASLNESLQELGNKKIIPMFRRKHWQYRESSGENRPSTEWILVLLKTTYYRRSSLNLRLLQEKSTNDSLKPSSHPHPFASNLRKKRGASDLP